VPEPSQDASISDLVDGCGESQVHGLLSPCSDTRGKLLDFAPERFDGAVVGRVRKKSLSAPPVSASFLVPDLGGPAFDGQRCRPDLSDGTAGAPFFAVRNGGWARAVNQYRNPTCTFPTWQLPQFPVLLLTSLSGCLGR
jgi:hypothetical protein